MTSLLRFEFGDMTAHRRSVFALSAALLAAIVTADYLTGFTLSLSSLYLAPIALITLGHGMKAGLSMAVVAHGAWIGVNAAGDPARAGTFLILWEGGIHLATAAAFVVLLDKLKRSLETEIRRSRRDALTHLPNRHAFFEAVDAERKRSRRYGGTLSIAYIDIDDFKQLNDQQGHRAGDRALRTLAAAMLRHVRQVDVPARLGGDEFAVAYVETSPEDAVRAVTLLRDRLLKVIEKHDWPISLSIGLACFRTAPRTVEAMVNAADRLMYQAKQREKGGIVHKVI
jgi:diguanylate cyclase (GGDEF)-like protein